MARIANRHGAAWLLRPACLLLCLSACAHSAAAQESVAPAPSRHKQALRELRDHLRQYPYDATAWNSLGIAHSVQGRAAEAAAYFLVALRLDGDLADAANNLAWLLATHPDESFRDGPSALTLAGQACAKTGRRVPQYLDTLAAAHAEVGQFDQARRIAAEAAARMSDPARRAALEERLAGYAANRPFRSQPPAEESFGQNLRPVAEDEALPLVLQMYRGTVADWAEEVRRWAWRLATADDPRRRDGKLAVKLAEMALAEASPRGAAAYFDTLAAAQAEAGRFDAALATLARWQRGAAGANDPSQVALRQRRQEAFTAGLAVREAARSRLGPTGQGADTPAGKLAWALIDRGLEHRDSAEHLAAQLAFQAATWLDPALAEAQLLWAESLLADGKPDQATQHLAAALWLRPALPAALQRLAEAHEKTGWPLAALGCLELAVRLAPEDVELLDRFAWRLATFPHPRVNSGAAALPYAQRAIRLAGEEATARHYDTLAAALAARGDFPQAVAAVDEAVARFRADQEAEFVLEDLQLRRALYQAGRSFSTVWLAHVELAAVRYREGDLRGAAFHFEQAARIRGGQ